MTSYANISRFNGQHLKAMIESGSAWLENNYQQVNELNVFPVPDGDTGINMLLTMQNACREVAALDESHAGKMSQKIYNGALMGARGNSGVILSQLLLGIAKGLEDKESFDAAEFAVALRSASYTADNVRGIKPVEGTILTVARDGAGAAETAAEEENNLIYVIEKVVEEMNESVERTPDLLVKDGVYVLRDAGVVDSGGMGLAYIMEGILKHLKGEVIKITVQATEQPQVASFSGDFDLSGLDFPYDVQFLLVGKNFDVDEITKEIEAMGDSALVAGDSNLVKVHVHVTNPSVPIAYAAKLGQLDDVVIENMLLQYERFHGGDGAAITRKIKFIPPPKIEPGTIAVVTVVPGDGMMNIFHSLGAGHVIGGGQTMNPSTEQFVEAIKNLPTDKIILLPNNKNIIMAAEQACDLVKDKQVKVVATRTIPQGVSAMLALEAEGDLDEVVEGMLSMSQDVETGEVTTSVRDVTLNGITVKRGQIIGMHNDTLSVAGEKVNEVVLELLKTMDMDEFELITLYYGIDVIPNDAQALTEHLSATYPDHTFELQAGGQMHYFYILSVE